MKKKSNHFNRVTSVSAWRKLVLIISALFIVIPIANSQQNANVVPIVTILLMDEEQQPVNASKLANGDSHSCALLIDGTVKCWGSNEFGQLGVGVVGPDTSNFPVSVS